MKLSNLKISSHISREDRADMAWAAWLNAKMVYPRTTTHLSTNPAQRSVTSFDAPNDVSTPLSQTTSEGPLLVIRTDLSLR